MSGCFLSAALERQVLEPHLLQIHLRVRRLERSDGGRGGDVVALVRHPGLSAPSGSALQGPL